MGPATLIGYLAVGVLGVFEPPPILMLIDNLMVMITQQCHIRNLVTRRVYAAKDAGSTIGRYALSLKQLRNTSQKPAGIATLQDNHGNKARIVHIRH